MATVTGGSLWATRVMGIIYDRHIGALSFDAAGNGACDKFNSRRSHRLGANVRRFLIV